ncbi:hypothetical protein [Bifidobacterium psychraerophilum]|uniref:hypothetical protein n=1 Tax=Bifidobacterium psychraerophilum TaxID=218140 RepID=UPI0023F00C42|nr:hypothetical protein [Bifidobacterium psychraerophilum]MCI1660523.1 hypothetical protein [Bifidobacterium psychraerophilum]MCI1805155.1 hypothetical protein [Bifidobacterium psychraerophilum]MCI2175669.1 hypothetical protein [Bifidobacterium psychraerophilum]MCI2181675.1 hypothetical protein [Bifidobacterium psychraerophilum]
MTSTSSQTAFAFAPPAGIGALPQLPGMGVDASWCRCHAVVRQCQSTVSRVTADTDDTVRECRSVLVRAGLLDWQGAAAECFRAELAGIDALLGALEMSSREMLRMSLILGAR